MQGRSISCLALLSLALCFLVKVHSAPWAETGQQSANVIPQVRLISSNPGSAKWERLAGFPRAVLLEAASLQGETASLQRDSNTGIGARLLAFFSRMADSSWSTGLHESRYAYDLIESVHVWALCLFFGLAVMFDLRLLNWTMRTVPVSEVARRLLPWTVVGFVIMVISGALLFSAIPLRSYQNIFFRTKMILLLVAGLNVWIFHSGVYRRVATWDVNTVPPRAARVAGALSIALWICIVLSGRMIAYNWFDCDRQPQRPIINFLTSCVPSAPEH
jgi:uncharacterized protein DUF6644